MTTKNSKIVPADAHPLTPAKSEIVNPQSEILSERWVTAKTVLAHFGMSERTLRHYVNDLKMPRHLIGVRQMRFKLSEIQACLENLSAHRFAATGRANTFRETRKRIVLIPILNGLEILSNPATRKGSANLAQGEALRPNAAKMSALKGQPKPVLAPRCTPGRKPKTTDTLSLSACKIKTWRVVVGLIEVQSPNMEAKSNFEVSFCDLLRLTRHFNYNMHSYEHRPIQFYGWRDE